ncbi:unnamed protein product [Gordionus sp. m RMFG-2023]
MESIKPLTLNKCYKCRTYSHPFPYKLLKSNIRDYELIPIRDTEYKNIHKEPKIANDGGEGIYNVKRNAAKFGWNSKFNINNIMNSLIHNNRSNGKLSFPSNENYPVLDNTENGDYNRISSLHSSDRYIEASNDADSSMSQKHYSGALATSIGNTNNFRGNISPCSWDNAYPLIRRSTDKAILAEKEFYLYRSIGKGNFSKVVVVSNPSGTQLLAVKIIDLMTAPMDFRSKFLPRELKFWPTLSHPNIIKMYSYFKRYDKIYVMLEFACHGDVLEYVQKFGKLSEQQSKKWFKQTASAIEYLHETRGLAHRDLKLENLLLDCSHNIKLADFGFCREVTYKSNYSDLSRIEGNYNANDNYKYLSQTFCGSKSYASPEILKSIPYDPKKADIWSLGVILCVWVSSHMPFDEKIRNTERLVESQKRWKVENLKNFSNISSDCEDLISKLLTFDQCERSSIIDILNHQWLKNSCNRGFYTPSYCKRMPTRSSNEKIKLYKTPIRYNNLRCAPINGHSNASVYTVNYKSYNEIESGANAFINETKNIGTKINNGNFKVLDQAVPLSKSKSSKNGNSNLYHSILKKYIVNDSHQQTNKY